MTVRIGRGIITKIMVGFFFFIIRILLFCEILKAVQWFGGIIQAYDVKKTIVSLIGYGPWGKKF